MTRVRQRIGAARRDPQANQAHSTGGPMSDNDFRKANAGTLAGLYAAALADAGLTWTDPDTIQHDPAFTSWDPYPAGTPDAVAGVRQGFREADGTTGASATARPARRKDDGKGHTR